VAQDNTQTSLALRFNEVVVEAALGFRYPAVQAVQAVAVLVVLIPKPDFPVMR
jgi:hypothetical protein